VRVEYHPDKGGKNFMRSYVIRFLFLFWICSSGTALAFAQKPVPSPTPRRALAKPATGSRGFDQFTPRDASARLIAAGATRSVGEPNDHYSKGEAYYKQGNYEAAVKELREALKQSPNSDESHYVLGLALTELGQLKEAAEEFHRVIDLAIDDEPKILSAYNMGNAYADLGDYEDAIESYQYAIKLDPTLSKPHNNLGLVYAATGKLSEAAAEFAEAVRLKPSYAEAHYNLGVAYVELGKKAQAEEQQRALATLKSELAEKLRALIAK
jgi:tetratricopeptide (TPR) repeat protein